MNSREILRRLVALESEMRTFEPPPKRPLGMWLLAFHIGRWQSHESVAEASARALGYENSMGFIRALQTDLDGVNIRYQAALAKMLAAEGVDFNDSPEDERWAALVRLVDTAEKGGMQLPNVG